MRATRLSTFRRHRPQCARQKCVPCPRGAAAAPLPLPQPWVNPPSICAIEVPAAIVSTPEHWSTVTDWYPARPGRVAGMTLSQAARPLL